VNRPPGNNNSMGVSNASLKFDI